MKQKEDIETTIKFLNGIQALYPRCCMYDATDLAERRTHVAVLYAYHDSISTVLIEFEGSPPKCPIMLQYMIGDDPVTANLYLNNSRMRQGKRKVKAIKCIMNYLRESGYLRRLELIHIEPKKEVLS